MYASSSDILFVGHNLLALLKRVSTKRRLCTTEIQEEIAYSDECLIKSGYPKKLIMEYRKVFTGSPQKTCLRRSWIRR